MSRKAVIGLVGAALILLLVMLFGPSNTETEELRENILGQYSYMTLANKNNTLISDIPAYSDVRASWASDDTQAFADRLILDHHDIVSTDGVVLSDDTYDESDGVVRLDDGDTVVFSITSDQSALYRITLDYQVESDSILAPEIDIQINGVIPFIEAKNIILYPLWERIERPEDKRYDRYEDELLPYNSHARMWQTMAVKDAGQFQDPLFFKLDEGMNELSFSVINSPVSIGVIQMGAIPTPPTYEDYRDTLTNSGLTTGEQITIEAEAFTYKNALNIKATSNVSPDVHPYVYNRKLLNMLDGYTFDDGGSTVTYTFTVEHSGDYNIALKYMQNFKDDIPSYRDILINNEILFEDLEAYPFHYTNRWKNEILGNVDGPFEIYLDQGVHTLTLRVSTRPIMEIKEDIEGLMEDITALSLEVMKLTGGKTDAYRDWDLETYIPTISDDLERLSTRALYNYFRINELNDDPDVFSADVNALLIAHELLSELANDPDMIPDNMTKLSEGSGSALQLIGTVLPILSEQGMDIDSIHVFSGTDLPEPRSKVLTRLFDSLRRFVYSFFDERYIYRPDEEAVTVWVKKSKGYVDIMQQMIDEEFTDETGIKIELAILREEQKLILANSSGDLPDVAMNLASEYPYDLALRGILEDITQFDGFDAVAEEYNPQLFTPFVYEDGIYAMPDTLGATLLFYRTDIINGMELAIPESWDDVISMLPTLQNNGMNFYHTLSSINAFKTYIVTAPMIYQFGGDFIDPSGRFTTIDMEETIDALRFMTDLYRIYGLPLQIPSFYQHFRSGTLPIGIGDMNMYLQFKYAAPELAGKWGVALLPGVLDEDTGLIRRYVSNEASGNVIFNTTAPEKKDKAWAFLEWWASKDVQARFTYNVQATLGETFLYMTANEEAFAESSWPTDTKQMILDQWEWLRLPQTSPGNYMIEREISNIWNKVVFDDIHVRSAIDDAIPKIDRELERKLREFGYLDAAGNITRPLILPTYDTIGRWLDDEA